jgi:hypothetical protein
LACSFLLAHIILSAALSDRKGKVVPGGIEPHHDLQFPVRAVRMAEFEGFQSIPEVMGHLEITGPVCLCAVELEGLVVLDLDSHALNP